MGELPSRFGIMLKDPLDVAEVAVRRFARLTNLSISGQSIALRGDDMDVLGALARMLGDMGAHLDHKATLGIDCQGDNPVISLAGTQSDSNERPAVTRERVDWVRSQMPLVANLIAEFSSLNLVRGKRIGCTLALEPKTAALLLGLRAAGATPIAFGFPDELHTEIPDILRDAGIEVFVAHDGQRMPRAQAQPELGWVMSSFLDADLDYLIDDGSHLIRQAANRKLSLLGASEETTSGIRPLRRHPLPFPVMAANDAPLKTDFDNAFGTGQSTVLATLDLLAATGESWQTHTKRAVVVGFGPVGTGVARHLRALGAYVSVIEQDPVRALHAKHMGYRVYIGVDDAEMTLREADLVMSATGVEHTINTAILDLLSPGCAVSVAGGVEQEIALDELAAAGASGIDIPVIGSATAGTIQRWTRAGEHDADGAGILILDHGGCINLSAAEGNPIDIMDYSFAVQLESLRYLISHPELPGGLHQLPADVSSKLAITVLKECD